MVDTVRESLTGLVLTGLEIERFTGWSSPMIEDYLTNIENLVRIATAVDAVSSNLRPTTSPDAPQGAPTGLGIHIQVFTSGTTIVRVTWSYIADVWTETSYQTAVAPVTP